MIILIKNENLMRSFIKRMCGGIVSVLCLNADETIILDVACAFCIRP